jgi:hypothetical protein
MLAMLIDETEDSRSRVYNYFCVPAKPVPPPPAGTYPTDSPTVNVYKPCKLEEGRDEYSIVINSPFIFSNIPSAANIPMPKIKRGGLSGELISILHMDSN